MPALDLATGRRHRALVDEELIITSLRRSALFGPADPEALQDIARQLRRRRFRRHEIIFHQGDPGEPSTSSPPVP